jgi:hypothetical protein
MSQQYTKAEVAQHKDEKSMFIIVDDGVYDIAGMLFISRFYPIISGRNGCQPPPTLQQPTPNTTHTRAQQQ